MEQITQNTRRVQFGDLVANYTALSPSGAEKARVEDLPAALLVDRGDMKRFVQSAFKNIQAAGYVCLRSFDHATGRPVTNWAPFEAGFIDRAAAMAQSAADDVSAKVFAPPICLFGELQRDGKRVASEDNVLAAPILSVELDQRPSMGAVKICEVLGPPTIVVHSGGLADGDPKLHLHWRLIEPAAGPVRLAKLKRARHLAALIAGGDTSATPVVHPLRWPGSWHRKDSRTPRRCTTREINDEFELDLDSALLELERAAGEQPVAPSVDPGRRTKGGFKSPRPLSRDRLLALAAAIPNEKVDWQHWNKIGMAFFDSSHGDDDGREAWEFWSDKIGSAHDAEAIEIRWAHFHRSPPSELSIGTLAKLAETADPTFRAQWLADDWFDESAAAKARPLDTDAQGWSAPQDIFGFSSTGEAKDPAPGALPAVIEAWARDQAERIGVSVGFAAAAALAACAGAIGSKRRIQPRQHDTGWLEPATLWFALVEDPGGKKSPIISAAIRPLQELEGEFHREDEPAHREWSERQRRRRKSNAPDANDAEPTVRRLMVDSFTMEALANTLKDNPAVLIAQHELTELIGSMDAYKANKGADRPRLLRLFDGGSSTVDRAQRRSIRIETWSAGVLGGIQPRKVADMASGLDADGLLQRFIPILGDGRFLEGADRAPDAAAQADYKALLQALAADRPVLPSPVRLSASAGARWLEHKARWDPLRNLQGVSDAWKGHFGKWTGIGMRVLLVFHVCEQWNRTGGAPEGVPVDTQTVDRCAKLIDWLLENSARFYEQIVGAGESWDDARWIAGFLLAHGRSRVTRRDIGRARHQLSGAPARISDAMRNLEAAGWVRAEAQSFERHTQNWTVNPRASVVYRDRAANEKAWRERVRQEIADAGDARRKLAFGE